MNGYVYILQDETGRFYIGSTDDVNRRMRQHAQGRTRTTARMTNPKLVLVQEYVSLDTARKIEARVKKLKRKDYIAKIVAEGEIRMR